MKIPPPACSSVIPGQLTVIWYDPVPPALTMSQGSPAWRIASAHPVSRPIAALIFCSFSTGSAIRSRCPSYPMIPANRRPCSFETACANSRVSRPGRTPTRSSPRLTSRITRGATPAARQIAASGSACAKWSMVTIGSACRQSAAIRCHFRSPTTIVAIRMSRIPPAAITSASETFAQVTPIAPAASSSWAIAGVLWHFSCGRHCTPRAAQVAAILRIFASMRSRSMHSRGVSRSDFEAPINDCDTMETSGSEGSGSGKDAKQQARPAPPQRVGCGLGRLVGLTGREP